MRKDFLHNPEVSPLHITINYEGENSNFMSVIGAHLTNFREKTSSLLWVYGKRPLILEVFCQISSQGNLRQIHFEEHSTNYMAFIH